MAIVSSLISWYFRKRMPELEQDFLNAELRQEEVFKYLIRMGLHTKFGEEYDFKSIRNYDDFKNRIPVQSYESLKPYIERTMKGEAAVLWPSDIKWFAKSSGTTSDKSKFIPVSFEALDLCHFQGGRDVLTLFCNKFPDSPIFNGKGLVIGGSHKVNSLHEGSFYGDLSAVIMSNLPFWVNFLRTPEISIALMDEWEQKIERMAQATVREDVTNISGVPTWTIVLFNRLLEMTGKSNMLEVWPNLELYIHGGVSFTPYREQFKKYIPSDKMIYFETYNASEGFFGIQDPDYPGYEMFLMPNYGIFYEFIAMNEFGNDSAKVLSLGEVEPGVNYAVLISTNGGLWRYVIGDTIQFATVKPYRFHITGRTRLFINAFGEEVVIENAEKALAAACKETAAEIVDFTAAPIYLTEKEAGHEWLIEFKVAPNDPIRFTEILDQTLKQVNSDYEAKRHKDIALKAPKMRILQKGCFENWLKFKGKLGGQHKVPRLSNDRKIVEEILAHPEWLL